MKIRSLEIENFRNFTRPTRISGFGDGINVLCRPNRFGKSNILAAIRGLLFERYRSRVEEVRRMQPLGSSVSPVLAMDIDLASGRYRIEKRFLHRDPHARLTRPDGSRIEGDPAEEELQRLLGFTEPGKQGSTAATTGIWGALWVPTRSSFTPPEMAEGTRRTFQECLDAEVGALAGGARGQDLLVAVRREIGGYLDGYGKPKGRYKDVAAQIAILKEKTLPGLESRLKELAGDLEALSTAKADRTREVATDEDESDRAAIADAQTRRDAAMQLAAQLGEAGNAVSLAQTHLNHAEDERRRRQERVEAIGAAEAAVNAQADQVTAARAQEGAAAQEAARLRQRVQELEARQREAQRTVQGLHAALDTARTNEELIMLEDALVRARAAQARANALAGRIDTIKVDQKTLGKIQKAARQRDSARAALQALATRVRLEIDPGAITGVTIDGRPLPHAKHELSVIDATQIAISGVGRIAIEPAIKDRDGLDREVDAAERGLDRLLVAAGVVDVDEAESKWAERERLAGEADVARVEMAVHAPARPGLDPGPDALAGHVDRLRANLAVRLKELALEDAPARQEVNVRLSAAETQAEDLAEQVVAARSAWAAAEALLKDQQKTLRDAETSHLSATAERHRLQREHADALAAESADALRRRIESAQQARADALSKQDALRRQDTGETVEILDARLERLRAKIENRRDRLVKLNEAITGLQMKIGMLEGDGIGERLARHERELAQLEEERAFFERDIRVLRLLADELAAAEHAAKERYMAPIVTRIQPYLRQLLPGAIIECDEDLAITGILYAERPAEDFDVQSDGTKEQIAVLTRLAFAELLVDRGKPAAVILDDALAHSDPGRLERMFDILTHAARKTQIVIFGCDESRFLGLGGARLVVEELSDRRV